MKLLTDLRRRASVTLGGLILLIAGATLVGYGLAMPPSQTVIGALASALLIVGGIWCIAVARRTIHPIKPTELEVQT